MTSKLVIHDVAYINNVNMQSDRLYSHFVPTGKSRRYYEGEKVRRKAWNSTVAVGRED